MSKVDFDEFANNYDDILKEQLFLFERDTAFFSQHKVSLTKKLLKHRPVRILEFGCGVGNNIRYFASLFPDVSITGCDISQRCLDIAIKENPSAKFFLLTSTADSICGNFDLVFIANVLHHINPNQRHDTLSFIKSLTVNNGELFIFEHNPYNPVTRHIVRTCPFDADAELIKPRHLIALLKKAGFSIIERQYILFFPSFLSGLRPMERYLKSLPLGGQYVVHASL